MVSDVPVGAFLSGGIDSSSIVASAARLNPEPLKTFSIGFSEPDYNELEHARLVAALNHTDHHELTLGPDALDQIGGPGLASGRAVRRLVRDSDVSWFPSWQPRSVKVVLSGDGGDELFAGYDKYLVEQRERGRKSLPAPARKRDGGE